MPMEAPELAAVAYVDSEYVVKGLGRICHFDKRADVLSEKSKIIKLRRRDVFVKWPWRLGLLRKIFVVNFTA